jgi:predicted nuclease of predicted toxin-antitoxin system
VNIWLDEQLSPAVARWAARQFDVTAQPVRELGLKSASDEEVSFAAREADAVVITKD